MSKAKLANDDGLQRMGYLTREYLEQVIRDFGPDQVISSGSHCPTCGHPTPEREFKYGTAQEILDRLNNGISTKM